jgi:GNAT superfamily N-acetyltransferase
MNKQFNHTIVMDGYPTHVYELIIDGSSVGEIEQRIPNLAQSQIGSKNECITHLYVGAKYRGKGYGRELVEFFENKARSQGANWIEVNSSKSAESFYEHLGFIKTPSGILGQVLKYMGITGQYYKPI